MGLAEIKGMSTLERLREMELLWDTLCHEVEEPKSPTWHARVLAERQAKIESGEGRFVTLAQLKAQLRK